MVMDILKEKRDALLEAGDKEQGMDWDDADAPYL